MASAKPRIRLRCFGVLLLLGLGAGCKSSSNEKLDAGQRKYCSESVDGSSGDGADVLQATEAGSGAMDMALDGQVPIDAPLRASMARPRTWQMPVLGWMPWIRGAATWSPVRGPRWKRRHRRNRRARWHWRCRWNRRDYWRGWDYWRGRGCWPGRLAECPARCRSEAKDASSGDTVAPTDLGSSEASAGADALVDSRGPDVPADAPSASPDTVPVSTVDAPARDVADRQPPSGLRCEWVRLGKSVAGTNGNIGKFFRAGPGAGRNHPLGRWSSQRDVQFRNRRQSGHELYTGPLPAPGTQPSNDIVLLKLDPTTGLATAAFDFGDPSNNDQLGTQNSPGVAVASAGTWA